MYRIMTVEDKVRVAPNKFTLQKEEAIKASLEERFEGITDRKLGVVLSVVGVEKAGSGKILAGDGALYFPVTFRLLTYKPELHELVKGQVIDVTEFGIFVRMGPVDGMVHVSQIMDDFVSYDPKGFQFTGKESKRTVKEGDIVRARVISVSVEKDFKVGLTLRQPGLGCPHWQEKKAKAHVPEKASKPKVKHEKRLKD
ncbi:MAG: DNA-directed RNA polymerase [Candidatus Aenigmarchaeota archaeon]|nr:DNA-directed RNA polymerase [Candidatus Aenigmarchaeota archaeon]